MALTKKQYIKKRGSVVGFSKYKKLPRGTSTGELIEHRDDGYKQRKKVYIVKSRRGYVIRDYLSLKILGTSKYNLKDTKNILRGNNKAGSKGFRAKYVNEDWGTGGEFIGRTQKKKIDIKTSYKTTTYSKDGSFKRTRHISTSKPYKSVNGQIVAEVLLIGSSGQRAVKTARSHNGQLPRDKEKLMQNAVYHASILAGFSPVEFEVLNYWYEYYTDKRIRNF